MSSEKHPEGDVGNREAAAADRGGAIKGPDVRMMSGSLAVLFPPAEDGPATYAELMKLQERMEAAHEAGARRLSMPLRFAGEVISELSWFRALVGEPSNAGRDNRGSIPVRLIAQCLLANAAAGKWDEATAEVAATMKFNPRELVIDLITAAITIAKTQPETPRRWVEELLGDCWTGLPIDGCNEMISAAARLAGPELVHLGKTEIERRSRS